MFRSSFEGQRRLVSKFRTIKFEETLRTLRKKMLGSFESRCRSIFETTGDNDRKG